MNNLLCPVCGGNDGDAPCAYPTEKPDGCLWVVRLRKLKAWLATPEAHAELKQALGQAQETTSALDESRKTPPELRNWQADI